MSESIRPQSSRLAEPLWTDPGIKSGLSSRELISTLKQTNKAQAGNEGSNILPKSSQARKKPPPPPPPPPPLAVVRMSGLKQNVCCVNSPTGLFAASFKTRRTPLLKPLEVGVQLLVWRVTYCTCMYDRRYRCEEMVAHVTVSPL